jgi:sec-independent protein translocase protein TatC
MVPGYDPRTRDERPNRGAPVAQPMAPAGDAEDRPRSFFAHLEELRQRLKFVVYTLVVAFAVFIVFSFQYVVVLGTPMWLPLPSLNLREGIAQQFFVAIRTWLVPSYVNPVVLTPFEPVIVQFKVALFLALVATSPVSTYEFWRFVAPALKPNEKRLLVRVSLPVVLLFLTGVAISFLVVLPFTFSFLYGIAIAMGAQPLLQLQEFLDFVLLFSLAFGIAFELPVVMYGLSVLGIVEADFWKEHWRFAVVGIVFFGAAITPDGSGVTMMLVSVPMLALYAGGYAAIRLRLRRESRNTTPAKSS